jgi:hypothetical protein
LCCYPKCYQLSLRPNPLPWSWWDFRYMSMHINRNWKFFVTCVVQLYCFFSRGVLWFICKWEVDWKLCSRGFPLAQWKLPYPNRNSPRLSCFRLVFPTTDDDCIQVIFTRKKIYFIWPI